MTKTNTVRHETFAAADAEAQRLARKHQDTFVVLFTVGRWVPEQAPLTWDDADTEPETWK